MAKCTVAEFDGFSGDVSFKLSVNLGRKIPTGLLTDNMLEDTLETHVARLKDTFWKEVR